MYAHILQDTYKNTNLDNPILYAKNKNRKAK